MLRGRMPDRFSITSRYVLTPGGAVPARVTVEGETIASIEPFTRSEPDSVDLGEAWLLPALTDTHVHIDEPGRTEWEGFATATRAAAVGGVTMLVDMPLNSDPVTTTVAALETKIEATRGQLWVDCGFWGGVVPGNAGELRPMVEAGTLGFKCFLCPSGIDEFEHVTPTDLRLAMPILRDAGVPLLVHAELELPLRRAPPDASPRSYATWLHSRPPEWEDAAVALVAALVEETGCRAHIVHLSSAGALETVRSAKARGLPLTAETCPHYLGLAAEDVPAGATEYKCAPPIRERANQDRLWAALIDGTLDFVVTDHSPCVPALKRPETGDFLLAWGGIASLQLGLRSVWTEARRRNVSLNRVVGWMAAATANFARQPQRGRIAVGSPADLLAFQPYIEGEVDPARLKHRHPTTPWAGRRLSGDVAMTWMRGQVVALDGRVPGPPLGRPIRGRA